MKGIGGKIMADHLNVVVQRHEKPALLFVLGKRSMVQSELERRPSLALPGSNTL